MRLASQQATASPIIIGPNTQIVSPLEKARAAAMVPVRMAMKVPPSIQALASGRSRRSRWSGRMPYLIGPNSAEITPKPNSASIRIQIDASAIPSTAMAATPISVRLSISAMRALSYLSASSPPIADKSRNGRMKIPPAAVTRAAPSPAICTRMTKIRVFFRKLSLNADRNWVQNSGANFRVVMRLRDIGLSSFASGRLDHSIHSARLINAHWC